MYGTIVNSLLIVLGSLLGLLLKENLPPRYQTTIIHGLGMVIGVIGIQMALKSDNILIVIISIVLGVLTGEFLKLDVLMNKAGEQLANIVGNFLKNNDSQSIGESFVTTSLIYCVGAMSVVGGIQEGLTGDANILYAKSLLDGVTAIFFAASMGVGVAFSAIAVFLYQGIITILAGFFTDILSEQVVTQMTATGGVLIIGISLSMLKIVEIKIANLLPSIIFAVFITFIYINF